MTTRKCSYDGYAVERRMMRSIWTGTISFGLVSVPVGLAKAQDRQTVGFRQIHRGCGETIKLVKTCPIHGPLEHSEVARGYEYAPEKFMEVPDGELEATKPDASKVIEVKGFVKVEQIDPVVRDRTYFLTPAKDAKAREGYATLVQAMEKTRRAALATFVLWGRENLCTVRSNDGRLMLDLLYYTEDLRSPAEVDVLMDGIKVSKGNLDLAMQLIQVESFDFDHATYFSEYREKLRDMLDAMALGKPVKKPKAAPKKKQDDDLFAALKASVAAAGDNKKKPVMRRKKVTA
jgi:DNA end-binding protein Ku